MSSPPSPSSLEESIPLTSLTPFDTITSPPPLHNSYLKTCCLTNGFNCKRLGSSYIYNTQLYAERKICIVGPHFPATLFIVLFITGATWFFGFVSVRVKDLESGNVYGDHFIHEIVCLLFWGVCNFLLMMTGE